MTVRIRLKRQKRRSSFLKSGCSCGSFEAVLRKRTKKKSPENRLVTGLFGGELGIRTLEAFRLTAFRVLHLRPLGQLSVYVIPFSFEKLFARTDGKNNKIFNFRTEQKLSIYGDFEGSILPNSQKISSPCRYDLFGTTPYFVLLYNSSIPGRICQFSFVQNRRIFANLAAEFWRQSGRRRRGAVAPGARVW